MSRDDDTDAVTPGDFHRPDGFSVAARADGGRSVVAVRGEVDLATVEEVRAALVRGEASELVLDLRDTSFLDTSGLRLILEQQRDAEQAGRRFSLVAGPPAVQRLFEIAGLTERLEFLDPAGVPGGDHRGD